MFKRVIVPTFFSLLMKLIIAGFIFWIFNGLWVAYDFGDGNKLGYDWLIAEVAQYDDETSNKEDALAFISRSES